MHSSRMRTAHSSSCRGVCLSACWDTPPGCGPRDPQARPLNFPLGCGPGDPPGQTPQLPPWMWPGNLQGMLGYHPLETCCKTCWDTTPPPPVNRITDTCKNITLPQLRCGRLLVEINYLFNAFTHSAFTLG